MTDTWLPLCLPEFGPPSKRGYGGVPTRALSEIEGEVKHSMEGTVAGAVGRLMTPLTNDPYTHASWHFSIPKIGKPRQHYALEAICWHAGSPGDRRLDTSLVGNLTLVGIEHEDYPDNKLNANQVHWTTEITRAIRQLCPHVGAQPPTRRLNLWEHRELSATSCPSGLIPWDIIIAALLAEPEEEDDMKIRFVKAPIGPEWATDGIFKMGISYEQIRTDLVNLGLAEPGTLQVAQEFVDWLIDYPKDIAAILSAASAADVAGGGLTFDDAVKAAKRAAKEGAG